MPASILVVDDETEARKLFCTVLERQGYSVQSAENGARGMEVLRGFTPDLILLDIRMPVMDGYQFCAAVMKEEKFSCVPVVFLTGFDSEQNRAKAFAVGAAGYMTKPIDQDAFVAEIAGYLRKKDEWKKIASPAPESRGIQALNFSKFQEFLFKRLATPAGETEKFKKIRHHELPALTAALGISSSEMAQLIAEFGNLAYQPFINPELIDLGTLPTAFCRQHHLVLVKENSKLVFVVADPFQLELFDLVQRQFRDIELRVSDWKSIEYLFMETPVSQDDSHDEFSAVQIADNVVHAAVQDRASDIHIEPKGTHVTVRLRVDGEMKDIFGLKQETGTRLISRFKVLGGMDIAERRKPQDGTFEMKIGGRAFKLRLATTSTPNGESIIIRILDPNVKPKGLDELGMTSKQVKILVELAARDRGFILVVGPTGSGKTTTIFSLLNQVDCQTRSLVTVEDPVEYRLPFANQQQVNEKAGMTFENVLKSAMRQDPDVLFLGEMRDPFSAKASADFASTGHLTISTLHTSNATTAIFRLERLGVPRAVMADTLLAVVAQRLLKKLCNHCKKTAPPTEEERKMLESVMKEVPEKVSNPAGCSKCNQTGYYGREGVYEVLVFDPEVSKRIRDNQAISEIRNFVRGRGDYLISNHAADKVRDLVFSPRDVYEKVLVEEPELPEILEAEKTAAALPEQAAPASPGVVSKNTAPAAASVLVAEDNPDNMALITRYLEKAGYKVTPACDGIEALLMLGRHKFDLIISDVDMPNLDGFKLMEMINQKGIPAPVLFLTGRTNEADELKGFELGAADYLKKPIQKEILLARVKKSLLSPVRLS